MQIKVYAQANGRSKLEACYINAKNEIISIINILITLISMIIKNQITNAHVIIILTAY